ncbi:hypothetical protein Y032_0069g381 [Ancylostoma ceylanicum]|uniref:Uncharacterized protein n=1 Tax=Ancylostoma ceylanicum TaxID=53326 RepID=A0A016TZI3_9BILA|nr:hypothetical protein Y032_0069g381 [Ancylostoma ceylanicum]
MMRRVGPRAQPVEHKCVLEEPPVSHGRTMPERKVANVLSKIDIQKSLRTKCQCEEVEQRYQRVSYLLL